MSRKILVTVILGLALAFAVVITAGPHAVQSQLDPKALQDASPYPGPGERDEIVSTSPYPYPEPESTPSTDTQGSSVPLFAVILVAVFVVVFVIAIFLVNRLRRQD